MEPRAHVRSLMALTLVVLELLTKAAPMTTQTSTDFLVPSIVGPASTNSSAIPIITDKSTTGHIVLSDVIASSTPTPTDSVMSSTVFGFFLPPTPMPYWLESWKNEIQRYLNASGIMDPNRRFIIGNQMYYCPLTRMCNMNFNPPDLPSNFDKPCCGLDRCSCTIDCIDKGTCCSDFATQVVKDDVSSDTCFLPQFRKFMPGGKNYEYSYLLRSKCLDNFKNSTVIYLCENIEEQPNTLESFLSHVPVTSNVTHKIYRNIYCAMCNEEDKQQLLIWKTRVSCNKHIYVFPTSMISLLQFIQKEKLCNIFYYFPSHSVNPKRCSWGGITKCNHTGEMTSYDLMLEVGCKSYTSLYNGDYRNVNCFMCNHKEEPTISNCSNGKTSPTDMAAFSALLDFNVFNDETDAKDRLMEKARFRSCFSNEVYDAYKNVCRTIECSDGFVYFNKTCKRIYTEEYLKSYEVYFRSTIKGKYCLDVTCIFIDIENFVKRKLPNSFQRNLCSVNVILDREEMYCNSSEIRDSEESAYIIIHIEVSSLTAHTVQHFITDILGLQDDPIIIANSSCKNIKRHELYLRTDSYIYSAKGIFGSLNRKYMKPGTSQTLAFKSSVLSDIYMCKLPLRLIRVMNNLACTRISLQKSEYNFTFVNGDICIKEIDECFESGYYTNMTDKIIVCKDDYLSRIANLLNSAPKEKITKCQITVDDVLNMVTFICLILSVVSLLITLVIYFCFRELRTIPGKNNMLLSGNLLIAQSLFLFGSGKNELEIGCKVIGLFLHLFWLSSLFMMSSSTIHMVRVFAVFEKPNNLQNQSNSALAIYIIYSFIMSGVFVLINVVSNLVKTGGKEIGYGGCICYISTKLMVGITFALPVGIVVLSNIVLFIIVIVSIKKQPKLKNSSENHRNLLFIYCKLSSLTGLTWLFGFVNEIIQSKILSYLFVIFNAGQGVYIMLAFICNIRVLKLLLPSNLKSTKRKPHYYNTTGNGSSESKQTFTSCSSTSTLMENKTERCQDNILIESHQIENTRL